MRACDRKKATRRAWSRLMKAGKINDARTGQWYAASSDSTIGQMNRAGSHPRRGGDDG